MKYKNVGINIIIMRAKKKLYTSNNTQNIFSNIFLKRHIVLGEAIESSIQK